MGQATLIGKMANLLSRIKVKAKLYLDYAIKDPGWFLMFLLCRLEFVRLFVTRLRRTPNLAKFTQASSLFPSLNSTDVLQAMQRDGYYPGLQLPHDLVKEIMEFASQADLFPNGNREHQFQLQGREQWEQEHGERIVIAEVLEPALFMEKIEFDAKLMEIAARYLKADPISLGIRMWWSFPVPSTREQQLKAAQTFFHYDPVDYGAIKFFFYLTDVDMEAGPHVLVKSSHIHKRFKDQFTFLIGRSREEIVARYSEDAITTVTGKAGFGFAEDPFCFHMGLPPQKCARLMLQVLYRQNYYSLWEDT